MEAIIKTAENGTIGTTKTPKEIIHLFDTKKN